MKHAFVRRNAFHFNLQVVHAARVQKRDWMGDLINKTIEIEHQVDVGLVQAQTMMKGVGRQISSVIANVTAGLQATATTILTQVTNNPTCASAQTANVPNIVRPTGMLLYQLY